MKTELKGENKMYKESNNTIKSMIENHIDKMTGLRSDVTISTYKFKARTIINYVSSCNYEIITREGAQRFIDELLVYYAPKTVRCFWDLLNASYKRGVHEGLVNDNPFYYVKLEPVHPRVVQHIMRKEEVEAVLKAAYTTPALYLVMLLAIETGLRRNQVLSLTWKNVDFINSQIILDESFRMKKGKSIAMSDCLSSLLFQTRSIRKKKNVPVRANDFICLTSTFRVMKPPYLNKLFKNMVNNVKEVPSGYRFQDLSKVA